MVRPAADPSPLPSLLATAVLLVLGCQPAGGSCGCPADTSRARAEALFAGDERLRLHRHPANESVDLGFALFARRALQPGDVLLNDGGLPRAL